MMITSSQAKVINMIVMVIGPMLGLLSNNPKIYFQSFCQAFIFFFCSITLLTFTIHHFCRIFGKKIQESPSLCLKEYICGLQGMYVASLILAWVLLGFKTGIIKSYTWNIDESSGKSSLLDNILIMIGIILFDDFYQYAQHWILHFPLLFALHETHHSFTNPSAFSIFAISPGEAVFQFLPMLFNYLPGAESVVLWIPVSIIYYLTRVVQQCYNHSGYAFDCIEKWLPKLLIATSRHHNIHHAKVKTHFAEFLTYLDLIFNLGSTPYNEKRFAEKYQQNLSIDKNK